MLKFKMDFKDSLAIRFSIFKTTRLNEPFRTQKSTYQVKY